MLTSRDDSTKRLVSIIGLVFFCFVSANGADDPITPPNVFEYNLPPTGVAVAKMQGRVDFTVNYVNKQNKTASKTFTLDGRKAKVEGTPDPKQATFIIRTETNDETVGPVVWKITFEKSSSQVKITSSSVEFNTSDSNGTVAAQWNDALALNDNSKTAYKCSTIQLTNEKKDTLTIKNARIQPFDVVGGQFGADSVCSQDQPVRGNWTVTQLDDKTKNSYTCIRLMAYVYLLINYTTTNGSIATANILVPAIASVSPTSTCNYNFTTSQVKQEQVLQLAFFANPQQWKLTMNFTNNPTFTHDSNNKTVDAYYARVDFFYDTDHFPNVREDLKNSEGFIENKVDPTSGNGTISLFATFTDHSYRCNANETTVVSPNDFSLSTNTLTVEAFMNNQSSFLTEHLCYADTQTETSDLIPIIIGAALAALVVVVLVAYLIGRARSRGSNYETI